MPGGSAKLGPIGPEVETVSAGAEIVFVPDLSS